MVRICCLQYMTRMHYDLSYSIFDTLCFVVSCSNRTLLNKVEKLETQFLLRLQISTNFMKAH